MKFPLKWIVVAAVILSALIFVAVQQVRIGKLQRSLDDTQQKSLQKRVDSVRTITDTVEVHLTDATKTVTKTITRVRVDTFVVSPTTADDTTHAVIQLQTLVIEHDKLQRECNQLVADATAFRAAVKVERATTDSQISGFKRQLAVKQKRDWIGAPDLVIGAGMCATQTGVNGCLFIGLGGRLGW